MKLLIVDDSAMIRRAINLAYEGTVFNDIQTAADGLLALTVFKRQMPDIVTLDITMPHMDGLAAMSQMLEIKPDTIILVISALADHHTAIDSLMRGANQFICKPFSTEELKDALDILLQEKSKQAPAPRRVEHIEEGSSLTNQLMRLNPMAREMYQQTEETPAAEDYPSGYVQPPAILDLESEVAVSRQRSFQDVYKSIKSEERV